MKTLISNIATTTEDFNIFGKILTYSIIAIILLSAGVLFAGVISSIVNNNPILY